MAKTSADRTILNLKPKSECVEGLRRYCRFFDMTMTGFLERKVRLYERRLLEHLSPEQREKYADGTMTFSDMSFATDKRSSIAGHSSPSKCALDSITLIAACIASEFGAPRVVR